MAELPTVSGRVAVKAFKRLGFELNRVSGSHHILVKPGHRFHLAVPVHKNEPLKKGLLRNLIRDAGVTVDEFCDAL